MTFACPICGSKRRITRFRDIADYITDERFDVTLCQDCGLGITEPMPDDSQIARYYAESYRGDRHAFTDRMRTALRSRTVARCFPPGFRGRLLDIGCGDGAFALHQKTQGWSVAVTEIHEPTLHRLRNAGIDAVQSSEAGTLHGPFDAITCWHVFEHALHPDELARWVRQIVAPRGIFQVTVPNLHSWQADLSGRHWLHLDLPRHRYHFDRDTLQRILESAGFRIGSTRTVILEYDWFGAIQSALNRLCTRPNVLFEAMTSHAPRTRGWTRDRIVSTLLAPFLAAVTLPPTLVSALFGAGATLDLTARPADSSL